MLGSKGTLAWALVCLLCHVMATEVRFYTIREPIMEESNNTISTNIQNLIASGLQQKVEQMLRGTTTVNVKFPGSSQCQTMQKLFRKYKREFNSDQSMADETWHSVMSTAYLKMLSPRGTARIPLAVKADITRDMIGCDWDNNNKFKFSSGAEINTQLDLMERRDTDVKGHLIPSRLCGPAKWYNLAPQSPHVRAAVASGAPGWADAETSLRKWFAQEGGRVEMLVMPVYRNLTITRRTRDLPEGSRRPSGFAFCYRLYSNASTLRAELADNVINN